MAWSKSLSGAPVLDRQVSTLVPALVRRWQGIEPEIDQASLDQHFISIHLGGPKRLFRRGEGSQQTRDVADGAYSVVPAGAAFHWNTEGPVDFVHIYLNPAVVDQVIANTFDRDPSAVILGERLGETDPLIESLARTLLDELSCQNVQLAYLDDVLHLLLCRLLRLHSNAQRSERVARHVLAPFRLRRATEFIEANLSNPIGVAEIAAASGISAYHFSRAFRQTTGRPPYAYLIDRRIAAAKALLYCDDAPLTQIARQCGFASLSQFSRMFRRETGATPTMFRDGN
jgi:AraC family transcriptional regulator